MLKFRGSGSMDKYEKLRSENGFGVPIQGTDLRVNVVHSYKHLGGVLQSNFSNMMFVDKRASCAMASFVPLAGRVFSSPFIDVMCKRAFARALIESSLLHLAHVRCLKVRELKKLNAVYMRVHRRIVNRSRYDDTADSDLDVRVRYHIESLDCALSRRRLGYLARLAKSSCCQVLLGVLSLRFEKLTFLCDSIGITSTSLNSLHRSRTGIISPWVRIVISDLCMLFNPETRSLGLHRPTELNFGEWWSNHEWHQFSDSRFFLQNPFVTSEVHLLVTRIFNVICAKHGFLPRRGGVRP